MNSEQKEVPFDEIITTGGWTYHIIDHEKLRGTQMPTQTQYNKSPLCNQKTVWAYHPLYDSEKEELGKRKKEHDPDAWAKAVVPYSFDDMLLCKKCLKKWRKLNET